ncbi:MAG: NADH-quinone oxidoreductase subunit N [Chloroflexi bacterium]|nr:NADH-quinone oxidoreductase subunit N [Chloroflexota bacterium]MCI0840903.1 NADH-quinone oxidoreductase subunit N [Chloroflexota bacterium]
MSVHDLYLLSPEISLAALGAVLILLDLVIRRKGFIPVVAVLGLIVPLAFSISLWLDLSSDNAAQFHGLFNTMVVDKFSLFLKFILLAAVAVVVLVSTEYVKKFQRFQAEYYALILFSATGMMLLASTMELITIYISLELTALPIAALAAFRRDSRSTESGLKFLILSAVSSAVLLYGMVIVYGFTGSTSLVDIAERISQIGLSSGTPFGSNALLFGIVLIVAGFGFKIASVPFQMWAPDVYEGSPTPITAFLSVASKAAGFAVILRVFYIAFPLDSLSLDWGAIFAVLSALSMTLGNLVALKQDNIKRMMGYSTVAHAGYILMGLAAVSARASGGEAALGASGVLFYLGGFAATNLAAFSAIIAVSNRINSDNIDDFAGVGRRAPLLAAVLTLSMLSLTGIPPSVGFWAKIYLFGAAINTGLGWLVVIGVVNSVVSAYYYLRVVKAMYLSDPESDTRIGFGFPMRVAVAVSFGATLFFGLYPTPLLNLARTAAGALIS